MIRLNYRRTIHLYIDMKIIVLKSSKLELPETWDELSFRQKLFAFGKLREVSERRLSPAMFRILLLCELTGYSPSTGMIRYLFKRIWYGTNKPFVFLYYLIRLGSIRMKGYWEVWKEVHHPKKLNRDIINYNLFRLSEHIAFAFTLEGNLLKWNREFYKNPFPYIRVRGKKYKGKKFIRDIAPFTDITTREYCDCCELYAGYYSFEDPDEKDRCLNKLISILYPALANYQENLVSEHSELISELCPEIKFGIMYWFAGIIEYYTTHPVYSILFKANQEKDDKLTLGMNETVLMIKRKGYPSIADDTVNDYFDSQIKILKDDLSSALASGVKIEELAKQTGLSMDAINRMT